MQGGDCLLCCVHGHLVKLCKPETCETLSLKANIFKHGHL